MVLLHCGAVEVPPTAGAIEAVLRFLHRFHVLSLSLNMRKVKNECV